MHTRKEYLGRNLGCWLRLGNLDMEIIVEVTRFDYQRGRPAVRGHAGTNWRMGYSTSVGVPTVKLSANQYQGGDIQQYKNKYAGMTIKSQEMVNRESASNTMLVYVCACTTWWVHDILVVWVGGKGIFSPRSFFFITEQGCALTGTSMRFIHCVRMRTLRDGILEMSRVRWHGAINL